MSRNPSKPNPTPKANATTNSKPASGSQPRQNPKGKEMKDVAVPSSPKEQSKKLILPPLMPKPKRNILEDLKRETEKQTIEISQLERTEVFEKETTIAQLETLNKDISSKTETIKRLSEENQELFVQLKDIRNEVDEKLKLVKIFKVKEKELDKREKVLQKTLKITDEELKIAKKNIETYRLDKEYYERLLRVHSDKSILPNLLVTIKTKTDDITNLKRRITSLEKIRKRHRNCDTKQRQLQKELEVIQNEFEFERKRQMTMTEQMRKAVTEHIHESKDDTFITSTNTKKKDKDRRRQPSHSPDKPLSPCKSKKKLNLDLNAIHEELNAVNNSYKNYCATSVAKSQHRRNSDQSPKTVLFKEEEKVLLEKLIPKPKLQDYERRFERIEDKKKELEEQLKTKNVIKKIEIRENKEKYVSTELQVIEQKKRSTGLNNQRATYSKEIALQKSTLKKLKDNLKFYLDLYKVKQKENEKLFKHLKEIQEQIDSGELVLKPTEDNDEDDEVDDQNEDYQGQDQDQDES